LCQVPFFNGSAGAIGTITLWVLVGSYINRFQPLLTAIAALPGPAHFYFTGTSLGGGAVNQMADIASYQYAGRFAAAQFVAFASPIIANANGILNFGFENDPIYKIIENYSNEPSSLDNLVLATAEYMAGNYDGRHPLDYYAHGSSAFDVVGRLQGSAFYDFMTSDSVLIFDAYSGPVTDVTSGRESSGAFYLGETVADQIIGRAGDDLIEGFAGDDTLNGAAGNDRLDGGTGNDLIVGGTGDDTFQWDPGDGNDTVEGQDGVDTLLFDGANVAENINIAANDGRVLFFRDVANVTMDLNDTETIDFKALGGPDNIVVTDLSGTDVTNVKINLAGPLVGAIGDRAMDFVIGVGTTNDDLITISGGITVSGLPASVVSGLPARVEVSGSDATDQLVVNASAGNDVIDAAGFPVGQTTLVLSGEAGADLLIGSPGGDFISSGAGADTALLGDGDDFFLWSVGDSSDTVEGQDGFDQFVLLGSNASENIDISANGGLVRLSDVANATVDLNDVEAINVIALGGADTVTANDLTGTDVVQMNINLASTIGGTTGDGQADTVIANATNGDDIINVFGAGTSVSILGLTAQVNVLNADGTNDLLIINAGAGDDVIAASGVAAGTIQFTALLGGAGDDLLLGGDGDNILIGGSGTIPAGSTDDDLLFGGVGNDTYVFSAVNGGHDTISGGEFGGGIGDQIAITNTGGTIDSLADLQALANQTDTVAFADGSSLSLGGQTWDQLSVNDVFFIV
jgi:Ca2+-binding RTX toxin-like protein